MFFFFIAANLTVYLSSIQLFANSHLLAGGTTLIGGILLTLFSKATYVGKKKKSIRDRLDCDCPECDCPECDCGCD